MSADAFSVCKLLQLLHRYLGSVIIIVATILSENMLESEE